MKTEDRVREELDNAHGMLDRLGAIGRPGQASIRERLSSLLEDYRCGKPLPTRDEVSFAHYGRQVAQSCCANENRNMNGGCDNCGDPAL